ncbi:DUF4365 domain-containing protein [Nocardia sp. NPDC056100]|uniref:DUF4365 domain-containing protein n=1 Tax=Nocardia sp. NPDC056100 TaxID=3345712 RepID=UPI0035E0C727
MLDHVSMDSGAGYSTDDVAVLGANGAKARFGLAYVRAVCSQAGVVFQETSPDEDVRAVDGLVGFAIADVRVQVKCTGQFRINSGPTATWPIEDSWRKNWNQCKLPVYFVLVIVDPDDQIAWLQHHDNATLHRAAAFWVRVDTIPDSQGIVVPKAQRLTADTLRLWLADVEAIFDGSRGSGVV